MQSHLDLLPKSWRAPRLPGYYRYYEAQVTAPGTSPFALQMGWCAKNLATLDENWGKMSYALIVDGQPVPPTQLTLYRQPLSDGVCRGYIGVLTGWSPGVHTVTWVHSLGSTVHDGWERYTPGEYAMEFYVHVPPR